jgi:hypothetical protein
MDWCLNNNQKEGRKMNQTVDIGAVMQGYMLGANIRTACAIMLEMMFTIMPRERERLRETVKRELTNEDWEDYWQFLGERTLNPKCLQRAEDREKILVCPDFKIHGKERVRPLLIGSFTAGLRQSVVDPVRSLGEMVLHC